MAAKKTKTTAVKKGSSVKKTTARDVKKAVDVKPSKPKKKSILVDSSK